MKFLIDTNIAIRARGGSEPVLERLALHEGVVFLSALSLAELQRGVYSGDADSSLRQPRLKRILQTVPVLAFDAAAAEAYGQILAQIGWARRNDFDRLIGAHALATGCTLVTANASDFADIPGLSLENCGPLGLLGADQAARSSARPAISLHFPHGRSGAASSNRL